MSYGFRRVLITTGLFLVITGSHFWRINSIEKYNLIDKNPYVVQNLEICKKEAKEPKDKKITEFHENGEKVKKRLEELTIRANEIVKINSDGKNYQGEKINIRFKDLKNKFYELRKEYVQLSEENRFFLMYEKEHNRIKPQISLIKILNSYQRYGSLGQLGYFAGSGIMAIGALKGKEKKR